MYKPIGYLASNCSGRNTLVFSYERRSLAKEILLCAGKFRHCTLFEIGPLSSVYSTGSKMCSKGTILKYFADELDKESWT